MSAYAQMTGVELTELSKLARLNAKVAKDDAEARGRQMLADAEAKLAAVYSQQNKAWHDLWAEAQAKITELDTELARRSRERGIPEPFRPRLNSYWMERGDNSLPARRAELRKVAQTAIAARVAEAKVEIDRHTAYQLTELTAGALSSGAARAFLAEMPSPDDLLPPLGHLKLESGEVVPLLASVTDETPTSVTDETATPRRNTCAHCKKPFEPARSDGRFCSAACRVAAHRARIAGQESER